MVRVHSLSSPSNLDEAPPGILIVDSDPLSNDGEMDGISAGLDGLGHGLSDELEDIRADGTGHDLRGSDLVDNLVC